MANSARGEADLMIGDNTYRVSMSMGALAEMASALGVQTFDELQKRIMAFNLPDMPLIVAAALKGNGYDVPMAEINRMDWNAYFTNVIPAFFRTEIEDGAKAAQADARPHKRQKR